MKAGTSKTGSYQNGAPELSLQQAAVQEFPLGSRGNESGTNALASKQRNIRWDLALVWAALALYACGFLYFYPNALTNSDEVAYVRQAVAFSSGHATVERVDPFSGHPTWIHPSQYPAGTSSLMAPFVWLAGWRGAFLLGLLALCGCTLITTRWISDTGASPLFALSVLGYVPAMVMARTGMSDVPSACLVAAGLWLFWDEDQKTPWRRVAAGFIAGASICFRETNPLLFALFFVGALVRRERHMRGLIFGGLAGLACRPFSALLVYGNALYVKDPGYGFTGVYLQQNLAIYLGALLLFMPAGLIFTVFYRGKRAVELIATIFIFASVYVVYDYNGNASGGLKQWVLAMRFMIPMIPLVAFAMAHTCTRWYRSVSNSLQPEGKRLWRYVSRGTAAVWVTGILLVTFVVNWRSYLWSSAYEEVVKTVYDNTDPAQPIMADEPATIKFLNELNGQRMLVDLDLGNAGIQMRRYELLRLLDRYKTVQLVLFSRDDSDYWVNKAKDDQAFIAGISEQLHASMKLQRRVAGVGVVRIWNVSDPS